MKYPEIQFEPFFSWVNRPRIMYSPGVRRELGYEMGQLGGSKVVIFTDQGLIKAGVAEMVAKEVRDSDLQLVGIFDNILQDARINNINEGSAVSIEAKAQTLWLRWVAEASWIPPRQLTL